MRSTRHGVSLQLAGHLELGTHGPPHVLRLHPPGQRLADGGAQLRQPVVRREALGVALAEPRVHPSPEIGKPHDVQNTITVMGSAAPPDQWYRLPVLTGGLVRLEPLTEQHVDGYLAAAGTGADAEEVFRWLNSAGSASG